MEYHSVIKRNELSGESQNNYGSKRYQMKQRGNEGDEEAFGGDVSRL